jgi:hypothetical protein
MPATTWTGSSWLSISPNSYSRSSRTVSTSSATDGASGSCVDDISISLRQAPPNWTNQTDYAHASLLPIPDWGGGLVYDLDVVPKVATERRWELVMRVSVWVYGSDVWCVGGCKRVEVGGRGGAGGGGLRRGKGEGEGKGVE